METVINTWLDIKQHIWFNLKRNTIWKFSPKISTIPTLSYSEVTCNGCPTCHIQNWIALLSSTSTPLKPSYQNNIELAQLAFPENVLAGGNDNERDKNNGRGNRFSSVNVNNGAGFFLYSVSCAKKSSLIADRGTDKPKIAFPLSIN